MSQAKPATAGKDPVMLASSEQQDMVVCQRIVDSLFSFFRPDHEVEHIHWIGGIDVHKQSCSLWLIKTIAASG